MGKIEKKEHALTTERGKILHEIIHEEYYRQYEVFNRVFNSQHTIMDAAREIAKLVEFSSDDRERGHHRELNQAYVAHFIETFVPGMVKLIHEQEFYVHSYDSVSEFLDNVVTLKVYLKKGRVSTDLTDSFWDKKTGAVELRKEIRKELEKLALTQETVI